MPQAPVTSSSARPRYLCSTPGSGDTGATTAHLSSALDDYFQSLERLHGRELDPFTATEEVLGRLGL